MFIARWQLSTRFGKTDECVAILRKWEIDVGQRIGWRPGSVRIASGLIGARETDIEFETRVDNLADLESSWSDMAQNPHHKDYLKKLEPLIVDGGSRWIVLREAEGSARGD
jgi:hypothetical protein